MHAAASDYVSQAITSTISVVTETVVAVVAAITITPVVVAAAVVVTRIGCYGVWTLRTLWYSLTQMHLHRCSVPQQPQQQRLPLPLQQQ